MQWPLYEANRWKGFRAFNIVAPTYPSGSHPCAENLHHDNEFDRTEPVSTIMFNLEYKQYIVESEKEKNDEKNSDIE